MKIYTKTGDDGETSLIGGKRIAKDDPRIEAYGSVDELNAFIGVARSVLGETVLDLELDHIQSDLFEIGAELASITGERFGGVDQETISALERRIDELDQELEPLRNFILPGGTQGAAALHTARTVCRRAERQVIRIKDRVSRTTVIYLNRLSDFLFVAARWVNREQGVEDRIWKRDADTN